jgi:hypothetical protein
MKKYLFLLLILLVPTVLLAQGDGDAGSTSSVWTVILGAVSVITTGASALFGRAWSKIRGKFSKAIVLLTEAMELGTLATSTGEKIKKALEDGVLKPEEVLAIAEDFDKYPKELADVKKAWKDLVEKE